jgi:protein-disulfide isomerase
MNLQKIFMAVFAVTALSLIGYSISSRSVNAEANEVNIQPTTAKEMVAETTQAVKEDVAQAVEAVEDTVEDTVEAITKDDTPRPSPDGLDVFPVISLGDKDAPVYLVEYASLSCGHCAEFHNTMLPQLKEEFIDKGQVYIEFRDFPTSQSGLDAAKLVRCMAPARQYKFMDLLFQTQDMWAFTEDRTPLFQHAKLAGLNDEQIEKCIADTEIEQTLLDSVKKAQVTYSVSSTPTIVAFPTNEKLQALTNFKLVKKQILRALENAGSSEE